MTFYLKYRPKNLDELDLPEVGESLKKIVQSDSIPHAFLFSGPKGTGKTSAARILAKIIECENLGKGGTPCDKCEQCLSISAGNNLDVIEMDAASHRGIDDVRALRDAVKLSPTTAKKKIYIIDEAHMLTLEASNALLKTLEEPPEHVIFILATTNPEKLIDTIRSRTTLVPFRKADIKEIVKSLKRVAENEKIKITDDYLTKIADAANGAFRDAIKMLEQFSIEGDSFIDNIKKSDTSLFLEYLAKRDEKTLVEEIEKISSQGISMENFISSLLSAFHLGILAEVGVGGTKITGLTKENLLTLSELFTEANKNLADSFIEVLPVEIAVVKWCGGKKNNGSEVLNPEEKNSEEKENKDVNLSPPKKDSSAPVQDKNNELGSINYKESKNKKLDTLDGKIDVVIPNSTFDIQYSSINDDIWRNILLAIRPVNASIEGLLRSSRPIGYDGKFLTLGVYYKFHKERLEDNHHKKILEDVVTKVLNNPTRIMCTLVEPPPKVIINEAAHETVLTETKEPDIVKAAQDIFGN